MEAGPAGWHWRKLPGGVGCDQYPGFPALFAKGTFQLFTVKVLNCRPLGFSGSGKSQRVLCCPCPRLCEQQGQGTRAPEPAGPVCEPRQIRASPLSARGPGFPKTEWILPASEGGWHPARSGLAPLRPRQVLRGRPLAARICPSGCCERIWFPQRRAEKPGAGAPRTNGRQLSPPTRRGPLPPTGPLGLELLLEAEGAGGGPWGEAAGGDSPGPAQGPGSTSAVNTGEGLSGAARPPSAAGPAAARGRNRERPPDVPGRRGPREAFSTKQLASSG